MDLLYLQLQTVVQNILTPNLQIYAQQWKSDIHQELLTHHGQMIWLKIKIKILEAILDFFLHNTPENWSTQVHMYAYAHNSQPLSELNLSPHEMVLHTIPRTPINFELNFQRDTYRNCTSQYCQDLPLYTHYEKSNLNPFFHKILSKPIPQWILATETAMIQIYHTVYENTKRTKHTITRDP